MGLKFFLIAVILLAIPAASAQIVLPEFKDIYSMGESIDSSFEIMEAREVTGLVKLALSCEKEESMFYTSPISLAANEAKKVTVSPYQLAENGNCHVDAILESDGNLTADSAKSNDFLISDEMNISLKLNKETFKPGEILRIKGIAIKANGDYVDGTAMINAGNEGYSAMVKKGIFDLDIDIKNSFPSGENEITIEVKDNFGNSNYASKNISVAVIPTSLEIIINNQAFLPDDILKASAVLYDQSGKEFATAISLTLYDSWGMDIAKKVTNSSEDYLEYNFTRKSPTGEWWVYAYAEGIRVRRYISVTEVSKIAVGLNESALKISNEGNIDFKKPLEILFQNEQTSETEIEELNLGLEGEKVLMLSAPDGVYDITVKTEGFEQTFNDISLTGKAVSASDSSNKMSKLAQNIAAIAVIIALSAIAIVLKIKRVGQKAVSIGKTYNTETKKIKEKL